MTMRKPLHHNLKESAESYKLLHGNLKEFVICFDDVDILVGDRVTMCEANRIILGGSITGDVKAVTRHAHGLQIGFIILALKNIQVLANKEVEKCVK